MNAPQLWRVTGASALGSAHSRDGRVNQDAIAWTPADGFGPRIVVAVSDGHGAAPHFRSDRGSRIAVERALDVLAWHIDDDDPEETALPQALIGAWREGVAQDMRADPIDAPAAQPGAALSAYGATLVAVAANDAALTAVQIGDGDLLLVYPDGRVVRPMADDSGLVGEETYSLCLDDAETWVRTASFWRSERGNWPVAAILSSDGVSKSFRDEDSFRAAARQLAERGQADWAGLKAELPGWLAAVSHHGSGDDASLCLALNSATPPSDLGKGLP